jgi:tRNA1Val (adenine37-N6)-methyltransferase
MEITEDIFRFKKFQIRQSKKIHRVGTDGVLLGAWVNLKDARSVLDVGAGTGLIALMLAQRFEGGASITAIEPDEHAFAILQKNVGSNPFSIPVETIQTDLQHYLPDKLFDLIACNPPFFENSLKPPVENRHRQRHNDTLPFAELISCSRSLLNAGGRLCIILPVIEGDRFIKLSPDAGLFLSDSCAVYSKEGKPQERWLLEFSLQPPAQPSQQSLIIMNGDGTWTSEYVSLTQEFYLNF